MSRVAVIGAGPDELVAALYLARARREVTIFEQYAAPGGATEGWVLPSIAADLELERHGLRLERIDPWIEVLGSKGERLRLWHDMERSAQSIREFSAVDAEAWPGFCKRMRAVSGVLERLYTAPPPDPMGRGRRELWRLASLAWGVRRLGRSTMEDVLRILPMPVADLLDEHFESDLLKAALGVLGVLDSPLGPRSAGSALGFVHRHVGCAGGVFRPVRSNLAQVLRALAQRESRIAWRGPAARMEVVDGAARAVLMQTGERFEADAVFSGLAPARTLLELMDPVWIDPALQRALRNVRARNVSALVHFALPATPDFARLCLAGSLEEIERAYDDSKYGRRSGDPVIELVHEGEGRVLAHVQYMPRAQAMPQAHLGEAVLDALAARLPGFRGATLGRVETGPQPQAELALDQFLWMRPVPELARYRAPVRALYLCGTAMHPGPGVPGAAGALAAAALD